MVLGDGEAAARPRGFPVEPIVRGVDGRLIWTTRSSSPWAPIRTPRAGSAARAGSWEPMPVAQRSRNVTSLRVTSSPPECASPIWSSRSRGRAELAAVVGAGALALAGAEVTGRALVARLAAGDGVLTEMASPFALVWKLRDPAPISFATDPCGLRQLAFAHAPGWAVCGTSALVVAALVRARLDEEALGALRHLRLAGARRPHRVQRCARRAKAMGIVMTLAALGTALGPSIGGYLTQYFSWHAIFFINIPVGIVAILLGEKVIPRDTGKRELTGFDTTGAGLGFVGLASLLFVVAEGNSLGWTSPFILALAALALVTLGGFVRHELATTDPILDLRLFKNRNFLMTNLILSLVFFSLRRDQLPLAFLPEICPEL